MKLFIANKNYSSWSLRPWLLLRQLEIPFEEVLLPFNGSSNYETFRRYSPTGRVPCLHDGELRIWDSMGITEYLAESHPDVWPAEVSARAWARCAAAEMHSGFAVLRNQCSMNVGLRVRLFDVSPALQRDVARIAELWEEGLHRFGGPFLTGPRFTAVDAFFAPVAYRVQTYGLPLPEKAASYSRHLLSLPWMQQWETAALAETWRDAGHDAEVRQAGEWIEDRRAVG